MSDLISRSALIEEIKSLSIVLGGKQIFSDNAKDSVLRTIDEQPTAYDIDKVVEELESDAERWEDSGKEYKDRCEIAVGRGLRNAIEIVKHGGVSDDVCEWTQSGDMAISPHTFSKYKIKQCDGLYALSACPYCGKKIKVVE